MALLLGAPLQGIPSACADELQARKRNCFACHTVERKLVGPAFREVAVRHAADRDAEARLARKIREGGAGAWGALAMPPHPAIDDAEAHLLIADRE